MYKRLLVAVDVSEQSYKTLDHAVAIAEKFDSELTLLAVVPKMITFSPYDYHAFARVRTEQKAFYQEALTDAEANVRSKHADLNVSTILMEGRPSATIVNVSEKEGCDMIIMGSRGMGGITGWVLGSTSHRVAASCKKPVMIIK